MEFITNIISQSGYLGVAFGMFLENIIPPIPSELIMFFSGASAKSGEMNIVLVILSGVAGSALGLVPWYYAGKWYGHESLIQFAQRHGRFLTLTPGDVRHADTWFEHHGRKAIFIGRWLPAIRTLIVVPAAATDMKLSVVLLYALLGSAVYDGAFAVLGYALSEHGETVEAYVNIGTTLILAVVAIWYLYRVVTYDKND